MRAIALVDKSNHLNLKGLKNNIGKKAMIRTDYEIGNMNGIKLTILDVIRHRFYLCQVKAKFGVYKECFYVEDVKVLEGK